MTGAVTLDVTQALVAGSIGFGFGLIGGLIAAPVSGFIAGRLGGAIGGSLVRQLLVGTAQKAIIGFAGGFTAEFGVATIQGLIEGKTWGDAATDGLWRGLNGGMWGAVNNRFKAWLC